MKLTRILAYSLALGLATTSAQAQQFFRIGT
ncbi:MAG: hypothetical protein RI906_2326, partial [Pseudomonadota bacterium]